MTSCSKDCGGGGVGVKKKNKTKNRTFSKKR